MRWKLILLFIVVGSGLQCQPPTELDNKLSVVWHRNDSTETGIQEDNYLILTMRFGIGDSVWYDCALTEMGHLRWHVTEPDYRGDINLALLSAFRKDSLTLYIAPNTFFPRFLKQERPRTVSAKSVVWMDLVVEEVFTKDAYTSFLASEKEAKASSESSKIIQFKRALTTKMDTLNGGVIISILEYGNGNKPVQGSKVKVSYTGRIHTGEIFDQDPAGFSFEVGSGGVIKGWDVAIPYLNEGSTALIIVPSNLAYGESGVPGTPIGPFEPLLFEISLLSVE